MRRFLIGVAAALSLAACATPAEQEAAAPEALEVAPLEYTFRELPNGLRVYAMPDANTANVAVHVWYEVGSKDDPLGRSGFAHLFEHTMFKSTRNLPSEQYFPLIQDVGGTLNASTYDDFTNYYQTVPANYLQRVLWAEAERMGSLVIDEATFASERDVVKEELRQRVLASPYGRLFYIYLPRANHAVHPYGRPGIGSIEDLDSATVEDVRAFHATYYRPDNAVLVVSGNFNMAQFNAWVDEYFAPIATPDRPIPRVTAVEPARTGPRELTVYEPNVPLPAVMVSYPMPDSQSEDMAAIAVIDTILTAGESSRLYQSLVYEQRVATSVFTNYEATHDPSAYALFAILSDGKSADEGVASLNAQIARMRDGLVTEAELEEAKNEIVTGTLQGRETAFGRANELADSVIRYGDPEAADRLLAQIQAITAADVQRVSRTLFNDSQRVTLRYLSEEAQNGAAEDTIDTSPSIVAANLTIAQADIPIHTLAPEGERVAPPAPAAPVSARIPNTTERTLANGLRVIVATLPELPLVSADLRFASGSSADPAGRVGVAGLTADLVTKGTTTRSATQIASEVESLGASLYAGAGIESTAVSLQTRSDRADAAFTLMADVTRNPTFAAEELDRQRQQALDGLQVALRQPGAIAGFAMARALYGEAPYGAVASANTLQAITRDDAAAYHAAYWRPDNGVLVIVGDVTAEEGFALAERHFGDWPRPAAARRAAPDVAARTEATRTIVVDLPQTGQAAVTMGVYGVARRDEDYFPVLVANTVLGGGFSARLNTEIRIKRGLSYGANSSMPLRFAPAPIIASAQTRNDAAVQVVGLMETELTRLGAEAVPETELLARKAQLIGGFGRSVETTSGLAGQISTLVLFGLPPEDLRNYVPNVSGVTAAQVDAVADRYFDPAKADLVIVGDAQHFWDDLRRVRRNAERININELDLDTEALK